MQETSSKAPRPSRFLRHVARVALWLMPLLVSIYLFYQATVLAETAGCQLGETCMTGDGEKATYYAFAAIVILLGFAFSLFILLVCKFFKIILTKIRMKLKKSKFTL